MKKNVQDKELKKVNGGIDGGTNRPLHCSRCGIYFKRDECETKEISEDCTTYTVYKCPQCTRWFYYGGAIYSDD